jgi:hypothetical protein
VHINSRWAASKERLSACVRLIVVWRLHVGQGEAVLLRVKRVLNAQREHVLLHVFNESSDKLALEQFSVRTQKDARSGLIRLLQARLNVSWMCFIHMLETLLDEMWLDRRSPERPQDGPCQTTKFAGATTDRSPANFE